MQSTDSRPRSIPVLLPTEVVVPSGNVRQMSLVAMSPADALAIGELVARVWPRPGIGAAERAEQLLALGSDYHGDARTGPRSMVVFHDDRVVAHALVVPRIIGTPRGDLRNACLAKVCSDPERRGGGLGQKVVQGVFGLVDDGLFDCSLFQTSHKVRPFYERLGACRVESPVFDSTGSTPRKSPFWDEIVMRYPASQVWPAGDIDLRGPGF